MEDGEGIESHRRPEGIHHQARGRHGGRRDLSEGRDQPGDAPQLEEEARRHDAIEMKRPRELEHENAQSEKTVADLWLDKAMPQDVIKRKL